jgi:hypothetical protein
MENKMKNSVYLTATISVLMAAAGVSAAELWIGAAEADITPDRPVALSGQFRTRISDGILSRCKANILALESREAGQPTDCAILVSCDLVGIRPADMQRFRAFVAPRLPGFDTNKLFLAATHTHTGPVTGQEQYDGYRDAMQPKEYVPFMFERIAGAVVKAWESRKSGSMAWGLGYAVVGHNRRSVYADGSAVMYGTTDRPDFRNSEGNEDHAVDFLYFLNADRRLVATVITLGCPSQEVENLSKISADFWGDVRDELRRRHGGDLTVLGFCAPAGDQSPRPMIRKSAEARMDKLRKLTRTQELARRIVLAFEETWAVAQNDIRNDVPFAHRVERFSLPGRKVTEEECAVAKGKLATGMEYARKLWFKSAVDRFEAQQKAEPLCPIEMHVLRLGDVAIATNPFELFYDYAMQIQGRSPAGQTVLIQLASPDPAGIAGKYLPTPRAVKGGGYSAVVESSPVGPEGGQVLVERTVEVIRQIFKK